MDIAWLRDLSLTIFGFVASVALIVLTVLGISFYRGIKPSLDSAKAISKTLQNISSRIENEVLKPLMELAIFIKVICQAIEGARKFFKKKGEKSERKE